MLCFRHHKRYKKCEKILLHIFLNANWNTSYYCTCIVMHRHKSRPSRLYIMQKVLDLWSVMPINTTEDLTQQTLVPRSRDPSPEVVATNAEAVTALSVSTETIRARSWRMRNGPCCQTLIELTLCCCNTLVFVSSYILKYFLGTKYFCGSLNIFCDRLSASRFWWVRAGSWSSLMQALTSPTSWPSL